MTSSRSPSTAARSGTWLSQFLDLRGGVPSHDRFNAIFAAIKPAEFEKCLLSWITALHEISGGQVVAIDGKTLRHSYDKASGKSAIHMVSAWATANHISLGQVVVDQKSNEITAIPKLLEILEVSGCLVTIDAMGCQVEIAEKIVEAKADYVLAVKGNQPTLHAGIEAFFLDHLEDDFARVSVGRHEKEEKGHGRDGDAVVPGVRGSRRPAGSGALERTEGDRGGDQRDDPRRQVGERCALLHPEPEAEREGVRGGGAIALGDRE